LDHPHAQREAAHLKECNTVEAELRDEIVESEATVRLSATGMLMLLRVFRPNGTRIVHRGERR